MEVLRITGSTLQILTKLIIGLFFTAPVFAEYQRETPRDEVECAAIGDDSERLRCYDGISGVESVEADTSGVQAGSLPIKTEGYESYFSRIWELDEKTRRDKYTFRLHRSTYVLPFTYNNTPNVEAVRSADPEKNLKEAEVVFQMSFKIKLLQDILGQDVDLWVGYTQRSFWQLYNFDDSSPFRETNYEPEFLLNFKTDYDILGVKCRFINFGLNHQSNGQSEPLSRSWNRVVANFGFEKEPFSFLLKTWYRIPETVEEDDNPGMNKYLGHGEIWAYYFYKKHRLGLMFRNNFDSQENHGAIQAEWTFPFFFKNVAGYAHYYNGYGESLLDYNHHTNRVGVGVIVLD
jgi:phospholipase A1/A2